MTGIQFPSWIGILLLPSHPAQCRDPPSLPFWGYLWSYYDAWPQHKLTTDLHVVHPLWESGPWSLLPHINLMMLKQRDNISFTFMIIPFLMGFGDFDIAEIISLVFAFFVLIFTCSGQAGKHEVPKYIFEKMGVPYGFEWSGSDRNCVLTATVTNMSHCFCSGRLMMKMKCFMEKQKPHFLNHL